MFERPEINSFLVQPASREKSQIVIFLSAPARAVAYSDRIFLLAEIDSLDVNLKNQVQILVNQLAKHYSESEKEISTAAFENSLEWGNQEIKKTFDKKSLNRLNLLFGVLKNNFLQFSNGGKIDANIYFKENGEFKNLDMIQTYSETAGDEEMFFNNLISGHIKPGNFLLLSTSEVLNFLTPERLIKIIATINPTEICRHLEKILSQIEEKIAFGGIMMLWPEIKNSIFITPNRITRLTPNDSIKKLLNKEKETARVMSPALWPAIKKLLSRKQKSSTEREKELEVVRRVAKIYGRLTGWQATCCRAISLALARFGKIIYKIYYFFKELFKNSKQWKITSFLNLPRTIKQEFLKLFIALKKIKAKILTRFFAINWKKRVMITLGAFFVLVLLVSLSINWRQTQNRRESANYNQLLNKIKSKIDEAESNIIYKNEIGAIKQVKEIKILLVNFPTNIANRKQMRGRLEEGLKNVTYKLQKIQEAAPQEELNLADFDASLNPTAFYKINNSFIFISRNDGRLISVNAANKETKKISNNYLKNYTDAIIQKNNNLLILAEKKQLLQFNAESGSLEIKEAAWLAKNSQIKAIGIYNAKLYAIDAGANQISRHIASTVGFGKGEPWLIDNKGLDLSSIISMAIDGEIYIAKKNGEIYKFSGRKKENLDLNLMDPLLTNINKIYTKSGSNLLFVFDSSKKRTIIWDKKQNKLTSQLIVSSLNNLANFFVDEKVKKIYLLDGQKVFSIKY